MKNKTLIVILTGWLLTATIIIGFASCYTEVIVQPIVEGTVTLQVLNYH